MGTAAHAKPLRAYAWRVTWQAAAKIKLHCDWTGHYAGG